MKGYRLAGMALALMLLCCSGCRGTMRNAKGECEDYKPACLGGERVCEETSDGCVWCTCVPD